MNLYNLGTHATLLPTRRVLVFALCALAARPSPGAGPATVSGSPQEENLATVTLSPQAQTRLAIVTAPVVEKPFRAWRSYPGIVVVAWDRDSVLTGPASIDSWTSEALLRLADRQLIANGAVQEATVELAYAQRRLERSGALMKVKAARLMDVDEAERGLARAKVLLETAQARRTLLGPSVLAENRTLWLTVPVYAGELGRIDRKADADIYALGAKAGDVHYPGQPLGLVPSGDATQATLTLLYQCPKGPVFLPGQRVRVRLPIDDAIVCKSVPWSAVLHDIYGGQWVYVQLGERRYERRRVQVRAVREGTALLDQGPETGIRVVVEGAAELFGTEFGVGH